MEKIKLKQFKELYPTYNDFETKVWTPASNEAKMLFNKNTLPAFFDVDKTAYGPELLYTLLFNKYEVHFAQNSEERQHKLLVNALLHTLPALHAKTLTLSEEALQMLDINKLLANIEKRYNEDADNKYASTETAYSSTPNSNQQVGTFTAGAIKEKNVINRKDATVRVKEVSNLLSKFKELGDLRLSGFVYDFVNSIEISSLWKIVGAEYVYEVKGKDGATGLKGDKGDPGSNAPAMFDVVDDGGKEVLQPKDGRDVQMLNDSGNPIISTSPHSVITHSQVDNKLLLKEDAANLESNNWEKITAIQKRVFIAGGGNPADPTLPDGLVAWGDLEDQTIRTDFMNNAKVGNWYTVILGSKSAIINIRSGDKTTNFLFTGLSINAGPTGQTFEAIQGNITAVNVSHYSASLTGDMFSPTLNLPDGYAPTQYMPKEAIKQMINDSAASEVWINALNIEPNQLEIIRTDDKITIRHGGSIKSTLDNAGHPVIKNATIEFFDASGNVINITYDTSIEQDLSLVLSNGAVNSTMTVYSITDWNNGWNGTGSTTGTDEGWKIELTLPKNSTGQATTFASTLNIIRMKLVALDNNQVAIDTPIDFFEDYNNIIGKSIDLEELWLYYNTPDTLGNVFTNYGPHAPNKSNVFKLPEGRTIYDIEMIRTYSNNKQKWYAEYNGAYLPRRLKALNKTNYDIFGDNCKIDIKINRVDDMGASWAEFNGWEIRPVFENGIFIVDEVHMTNKGIFTAANGGNFALLGSGNDIHYIVFKFKGGL